MGACLSCALRVDAANLQLWQVATFARRHSSWAACLDPTHLVSSGAHVHDCLGQGYNLLCLQCTGSVSIIKLSQECPPFFCPFPKSNNSYTMCWQVVRIELLR